MGKAKGHVPIRTCVSCGAKQAKRDLIRFLVNGAGQVVRDDQGKAQGRGAYVCRSKSCREELTRNRRLGRRFRVGKAITISPDTWAE
jgi:predicted RNA-binding protein YlxR (DUF448 family)